MLVTNEVVIDCSDADNEDLATERRLLPGQNINSDETHERNAEANNLFSPKLSDNITPIQKDDFN